MSSPRGPSPRETVLGAASLLIVVMASALVTGLIMLVRRLRSRRS